MTKHKRKNDLFSNNAVALLLDTSSLVRIREFSNSIPLYSKFFNLYTLEKNKRELNHLASDVADLDKSTTAFKYSIMLSQQLENGNVKLIKNGAGIPKSFWKQVGRNFPGNRLSYTDTSLLYYAQQNKNVILVTNDRELRTIAQECDVTVLGAFDLFLLMEQLSFRPKKVEELQELIDRTKEIIKKINPSD